MATIVTRAGKGSPLTHTEVDANFTNLNTDKVESSALATVATSGAYGDLSGLPTLGTAAATAATDYATAAQGVTADAALPKTGGAVTGNVTFSTGIDVTGTVDVDLVNATGGVTFAPPGAGGDTATDVAIAVPRGNRIVGYNDGYIRTLLDYNTSGTIEIGQNSTSLVGDISLRPGSTGSVILYEGGSTKLETTTTGVSVTGNIGVTGTVDGRDIATNIPALLGTAGQVLSVNAGATAGEWADAAAGGSTLEATASGALANGDLVVVNSDGTVSVVAEAVVTQGVGSPDTIVGLTSKDVMGVVYDTANDKFVVAYKDAGNSNYGTAAVGTLSGTTITWGTAVVFESSGTGDNSAVTYDPVQERVLVFYGASGTYAKVGTVSGTSISFGSRLTVDSGSSDRNTMVYHSAAQQHVAVFKNTSASSNTYAYALTVSGTSVSKGSAATMTDTTGHAQVCYDPTAEMAVLFYGNADNSNYPTVRKISISGTTPTLESAVVLQSSQSGATAATYDASSGALFFAWANDGNGTGQCAAAPSGGSTVTGLGSVTQFYSGSPSKLRAYTHTPASKVGIHYQISSPTRQATRFASISGTTITFDTELVVFTGAWKGCNTPPAVDTSTGKVAFGYRDNSDANEYGEYVVWNPGYDSTNLSATNFIGISDGAYADAATATVQIVGSVDDAQSGLTAGQSYYVQTDGTLSTTAGSPSVRAGTAVSGTKLIVKG